jgi:arabinosaccharide transport system substrate-binding protein
LLRTVTLSFFLRAMLKMFSPGLWIVLLMAAGSTILVALLPVPKPTGMEMWLFDANHAKIARLIAKGWNRDHPQNPVQIHLLTGAALQTRMMSGFYSNSPVADLIEVERGMIGQVFAGPVADVGFVDLTGRLDRENLRNGINGPSFSPWTTRGHIFGLPHDVHPVMLLYRADLVEAAGIDVSKIETWDDYFRLLRPLMVDLDGDGRPDRFLLNSSATTLYYNEVLLLQAGGKLFDEMNQPALNEPLNARVIAQLANWYTGPNRVASEITIGGASSLRLVREGYVIGILSPDFYSGSIRTSLADMAGKFKLMPLPAWEKGGRRTSVMGGTMLGVTKASRTPADAWEFAKQLYLSPANAERLYEEARIVTPIKANWNQPFYDVPDPYFCGQAIGRMYLRLAPDVPLRPSSPYYGLGQQLLNLSVIQLCQYADDHHVYDPAALRPEARRLLDDAQRQLQAQMDRNVFLHARR